MRAPAAVRWLAGNVLRWRGIVGLNYHRIGDGRRSIFDRGLWSATADAFDQQIRYLKTNFDIIAPRDIPYVLRVKRGRHVLVTFDDGYADNYTAAFPVLQSHKVFASFFVTTGYIDNPRLPWWDEIAWMVRASKRKQLDIPAFSSAPIPFDEPERAHAVAFALHTHKKLADDRTSAYMDAVAEACGTGRPPPDVLDVHSLWMTWDMIREMHRAGMTIGGHTREHRVLARMTRAAQLEEITCCQRRLETELGAPMRSFAYPVGSRDSFNSDSQDCLRERGVVTAFSYYGGIRKLSDWDNYDIPRIPVDQVNPFEEFRAMVSFPWAT